MEALQSKSASGSFSAGSTVSKVKKVKPVKVRKSVLQLSKELIPDGLFKGLSDILEPHELRIGK